MKVISLLQPWATLLVRGQKLVETRSFRTHYRGPIFIHASGALNKRYKESQMTPTLQCFEPFFVDLVKPDALPFGKIIGMVNIATCVPTEVLKKHLPDQELAFGDYSDGRWAWQCYDAVEFTVHTELKGQLGIRDCSVQTNCAGCEMGRIPDKHGLHHIGGDSYFVCVNMKKD